MSVLKRGSTGREVKTLQQWFTRLQKPPPPLDALGTFGPKTEEAVKKFQAAHRLSPADGIVGPKTWASLGDAIGTYIWLDQAGFWKSLLEIVTDAFRGGLTFRHDKFISDYVAAYGVIDDSAARGLSLLLRFIDRDPSITDVRWAAYMLATVKHECANTWQPIEEYGKGAGHSYGNAVAVKDAQGHSFTNTYYGRGYVQLTWKTNYQTMSKALYNDDRLMLHPELALEPDVAYKIMSHGMRNGSFTGKKLGDYISGKNCDYVNARRIINGTDCAATIADYALKLEKMLRTSLFPASR